MENTLIKIDRKTFKGPRNSTILITGGASGIGLATGLLLHELGNDIIIVDRQPPSPDAPESFRNSNRVLFQKADITNWKSQRAAFEAGFQRFGKLDGCFVNAGIAEYGEQIFKVELDSEGLLKEPDRRVVDVDMHAANDTVKLAAYYMRKDGKTRGGSIVLVASLAGYLASTGAPLYSAAKHGIVGLMRALKNDMATLGIAISVVAPAITMTNILPRQSANQSLEDWQRFFTGKGVRVNTADHIADAVVWLMSLGLDGKGKGLLIQGGKYVDLEEGIAKTRSLWMSKEMLADFRSGRDAPLFPNKL